MKKNKSLKLDVLYVLIGISVILPIIVGTITLKKLYEDELANIHNHQKQISVYTKTYMNSLTKEIENISKYIKKYDNDELFMKNFYLFDDSIKNILIFSKDKEISYLYGDKRTFKDEDIFKRFYTKKLASYEDLFWLNISFFTKSDTILYNFKHNNKHFIIVISLDRFLQFINSFTESKNSLKIKIIDYYRNIIFDSNNKELDKKLGITQKELEKQILDIKEDKFTKFGYLFGKYEEYGIYSELGDKFILIISQDYKFLNKILMNVTYIMLIAMLIFILISFFLSLVVLDKIFSPLNQLRDITQNIGKGIYDGKLKKFHYKEFDVLVDSISNMRDEVNLRENEIKLSLDNFKTLFDESLEIIVLHDNGVFLDVNNEAVKFLGIKNKEEIIGTSLLTYITDESKYDIKSNFRENTDAYELNVIVKGKIHRCVAKSRFIKKDGKDIKMASLLDITELKTKDKLFFQQSKMAAMGEMLENIAHQWRQPLSLISTCASGIKINKELDMLEDEYLSNSLRLILKNTQYLSDTIDDFRKFFKPDKQKQEFDINEVIEKALELLKQKFEMNYIKINIDFTKPLVISGYENEFLQVVLNLLHNSCDALNSNLEKDKNIFIQTKISKNNKIITIKDNAGGIKPELLEKVFEPYFTTKNKFKGTGIGLYMSNEIISKHMDGDISIKNGLTLINSIEYKSCIVKIKFPINQ